MKVSTLIEELKKHDPNARVVVDGYEAGFEDLTVKQIKPVRLALSVYQQSYYGPHEELKSFERGGRKAVLLTRSKP